MMGQMGDMYKLRKETKQIEKEMKKTHVFSEHDGLKITVTADQEIVSVEVLDETILENSKRLSKSMVTATNKALKRAKEHMAEAMKPMMANFQNMAGGAK